MKKLVAILCAIVMSATCLSLIGCKKDNGGSESSKPQAEVTTFVSLDVNPEIELTVDSENKVVSVYGANEDGKVLLYEESGIVGKDLETAIAKITDLAIEYGFLTEENKTVLASVSSSIEGKAKEIENLIKSKINVVAEGLGLDVSVDLEGAFSLMRDFDKFKAEHPDNQLIQGLTVEKFQLSLSASETGEVTLDVAVTMDDKDLIEIISSVHKDLVAFATDAYNKVKAEAFLIYDRAVSSLVDSVYTTFYQTNLMKHPTTFWYGPTYQAYKTMARGFGDLASLMTYVEKSCDYPISEELVSEVLLALDLNAEEVDKLKDDDGNITLNSIESYVDIFIKNAPKSVDLTALKAEVSALLTRVETDLLTALSEEIKKYEPQINQIITSAEMMVTALEGATVINKEVSAVIADLTAILKGVADDVKNGQLSSEKLKSYADLSSKKAEEFLTKIKADLSEEELAQIDATIKGMEDTLDSAKKSMEDTIESAEKAIKYSLSKRKQDRKTA